MRYQDNSKTVYFLRKDLERTKTQIKPKPTNKTKISEQKATKANTFSRRKTSKRGKIVYFAFLKKTEIVLITSFTILHSIINILYFSVKQPDIDDI